MRILSGMVRPHVRDQDRLVASAGSVAVDAALAISISQYFNARFARSAHGEVRSRSRYRAHHVAASAWFPSRCRNSAKLSADLVGVAQGRCEQALVECLQHHDMLAPR